MISAVGVGVAVKFETHIAVVALMLEGVGVHLLRGDLAVGVHCYT